MQLIEKGVITQKKYVSIHQSLFNMLTPLKEITFLFSDGWLLLVYLGCFHYHFLVKVLIQMSGDSLMENSLNSMIEGAPTSLLQKGTH